MLKALIEMSRTARRLTASLSDVGRRTPLTVEVSSCLDTCNHSLATIGKLVDGTYSVDGSHGHAPADNASLLASNRQQLSETLEQLYKILAVTVEGSPVPPPRQSRTPDQSPVPPPRSMSTPSPVASQQRSSSDPTPSRAAGLAFSLSQHERWRAQLLEMGFEEHTVDGVLEASPETFIAALGQLLAAPTPPSARESPALLRPAHVAAAGALSPRGGRHVVGTTATTRARADTNRDTSGRPRRRPRSGTAPSTNPFRTLQEEKEDLRAAHSREGPGWVAFVNAPAGRGSGSTRRLRSNTIATTLAAVPGNPFAPRAAAKAPPRSLSREGPPSNADGPPTIEVEPAPPQRISTSPSPFASPRASGHNPFLDSGESSTDPVAKDGAAGLDRGAGPVLWPGSRPDTEDAAAASRPGVQRRATQFVDTEDVSVALRLMRDEEEGEEEERAGGAGCVPPGEAAGLLSASATSPAQSPRSSAPLGGDGASALATRRGGPASVPLSMPSGDDPLVQRRSPMRRASSEDLDTPLSPNGARMNRPSLDLFYSGGLDDLGDGGGGGGGGAEKKHVGGPPASGPGAEARPAGGRRDGTLRRFRGGSGETPSGSVPAMAAADLSACPSDDDGCLLQWFTQGQQRIKRVRAGTLSQLVKRLVSDRNEDAEFLPAFVTCVDLFCDSAELLELLTQKHITLMVSWDILQCPAPCLKATRPRRVLSRTPSHRPLPAPRRFVARAASWSRRRCGSTNGRVTCCRAYWFPWRATSAPPGWPPYTASCTTWCAPAIWNAPSWCAMASRGSSGWPGTFPVRAK